MTILTPNIAIRRPSAGWGLSRLAIKRSVIRQGAIGSSLRWSDGGCGSDISLRPLRFCVNLFICQSRESRNAWVDLSVKWFAQRHEGTKRLLPVFVSSCEPKTYHTRKYRAMCSRFRGNDNVRTLGSVDEKTRRPSVGGGLSRLSFEHSADAIGSSPRRSDGVWGARDFPLTPSVCVARWMLKQVQHDAGRSIALRPLRLCVNPNPRRPNIYATRK